jgi:choline monooxygenase
MERRHYELDCNWKVFVDNYLDGGYHVPHLHKGLDSVLDYSEYTIETGGRFCLQTSPVLTQAAEARTGEVRKGQRALYYWTYPNLMINWYEGVLDTNLVCPRGVDRTEVVFDFYFADISERESITLRASQWANAFKMRTLQSASRSSAGSLRKCMKGDGSRSGARRESTCSTGFSTPI